MKYYLDITKNSAFAISEEMDCKSMDDFKVNELSEAGYTLRPFDVEHTNVGSTINGTNLVRVTAKVYNKYGVKTQCVAKAKKTVSIEALAKMSDEERAKLINSVSENKQ